MREQLVAWAGDCLVRGSVELGDGRLSDRVNELDVVTFFDVTLRGLDDGHEVTVDELEVERGELHVIEVQGRRGDPARRLRTVEERVTLELGPFEVTGNLHRPPHTHSLAALQPLGPLRAADGCPGRDARPRRRARRPAGRPRQPRAHRQDADAYRDPRLHRRAAAPPPA